MDPEFRKPANLYQGCIFAWKAFREGKTITAKGMTRRKVYIPSTNGAAPYRR